MTLVGTYFTVNEQKNVPKDDHHLLSPRHGGGETRTQTWKINQKETFWGVYAFSLSSTFIYLSLYLHCPRRNVCNWEIPSHGTTTFKKRKKNKRMRVALENLLACGEPDTDDGCLTQRSLRVDTLLPWCFIDELATSLEGSAVNSPPSVSPRPATSGPSRGLASSHATTDCFRLSFDGWTTVFQPRWCASAALRRLSGVISRYSELDDEDFSWE